MTWCFAKKLYTRCDAWVGTLSWWSCQSPVAHSCGFLNHPNTFCGGIFKLNRKSDADLLLYSLSHFKCDTHTVHMLTQWRLPPPLTSTVKSSLFTHAHSSPLSLAARLHWCHADHSRYINNGWLFLDRPHILDFGHQSQSCGLNYIPHKFICWSTLTHHVMILTFGDEAFRK